MDIPINYLAIIVSALAAFGLGWLWFGPLFGKAWIKEATGMTMDEAMAKMKSDPSAKGKMLRNYGVVLLMSLIMVFAQAHSLFFASTYLHVSGLTAALQGAFWDWLGFIVPVSIGSVLWENKSWKWWCITAGYYLVSLAFMSTILAYWQ